MVRLVWQIKIKDELLFFVIVHVLSYIPIVKVCFAKLIDRKKYTANKNLVLYSTCTFVILGGILRNYYCMDAASIIPVLMLDLKPADHMLDLCAGPGGKSLVAMQTLRPARIVCNEMDYKRYMKIKNVMESYVLHAFDKKLLKSVNLPKIQYTKRDGLSYPEEYSDEFDCVLCDVPCFTGKKNHCKIEINIFFFKMSFFLKKIAMCYLKKKEICLMIIGSKNDYVCRICSLIF